MGQTLRQFQPAPMAPCPARILRVFCYRPLFPQCFHYGHIPTEASRRGPTVCQPPRNHAADTLSSRSLHGPQPCAPQGRAETPRPTPANSHPGPVVTGAAPDAPSPRTRRSSPSPHAAVRMSPAAALLPCSPHRTAPSPVRCPQGQHLPLPRRKPPAQRPGSPLRCFSHHPVPQGKVSRQAGARPPGPRPGGVWWWPFAR